MIPEPKKRSFIFDREKLWKLICEWAQSEYDSIPQIKDIDDFIESEMHRFAREMLKKARPELRKRQGTTGNGIIYADEKFRERIDALIKELE